MAHVSTTFTCSRSERDSSHGGSSGASAKPSEIFSSCARLIASFARRNPSSTCVPSISCLDIRLRSLITWKIAAVQPRSQPLIDKHSNMRQDVQASVLEVDSDAATIVDTTELKSVRTSMIYQVLPAMVSSHLPTIPSLRRSICEIRDRRLHSKTNSITELSLPGTPPPGYTSRPSSGSATPNRRSLIAGEPELDFPDDVSERPSSSTSSVPPPFSTYETKTGINWKYAAQGAHLLVVLVSITC